MPTIMPAFDRFPKEGSIVGRLLAGYGELELGLCFCAAEARNDFDMVFKAMFRPRGVSLRIEIGDAIGRPCFKAVGLTQDFAEAIAAMRHCLKIRNQYAHCYWTDDFGRSLGFVKLETTAEKNTRIDNVYHIKASDIDLPTLQAQESYFRYTFAVFDALRSEYKVKTGKLSKSAFAIPKKEPQPPLCKP